MSTTDQEVEVGQQERAAKKRRQADLKFDAVLTAALEKVRANRELRPDDTDAEVWGEAAESEGEELELALAVRHLRDTQGVAWWTIGQMLGLPGAGDSAATGKAGAAFSRKLYARAFGSAPRTQKERGTGDGAKRKKAEQNEDRAALKKTPKVERVEMVRAGKSVIREDATDDEIIAMLAGGRTISWTINLNNVDHKGDRFFEQTADVHLRNVWVREMNGERVVMFHQVFREGPWKYREMAGPVRVVRVRAIHSVR
jgi:hypothetical protein